MSQRFTNWKEAHPWTEPETNKLIAAVQAGIAYFKIALQLCRSRSSCIGKANRLGLAHPHPNHRRRSVFRLPRLENDIAPDERSIASLFDLESSHCRYPHGDPGTETFHYCGADRQAPAPYCAFHCRITYNR